MRMVIAMFRSWNLPTSCRRADRATGRETVAVVCSSSIGVNQRTECCDVKAFLDANLQQVLGTGEGLDLRPPVTMHR
jgi:hypothetical protein